MKLENSMSKKNQQSKTVTHTNRFEVISETKVIDYV